MFICIVIFALSFFIYDAVTKVRPTQIHQECSRLEGFEWVRTDKRVPVSLPCDIKTKEGENVVLETTLPKVISEDTWID